MAFELTEVSTGNLVGVYSTQDAALREVSQAIRRDGIEAVATLALSRDDASGASDGSLIAIGDDLAKLVMQFEQSLAA